MDIVYVKNILKALADGVNPITGEVLSPIDSCNQPDIIRALYAAVAELEKAEKKNKVQQNLPENAGKEIELTKTALVYQEDDEILGRMYDQCCSSGDICASFKRTKGAIAARLVRLGKIQFRDEYKQEVTSCPNIAPSPAARLRTCS